jgi:hypothetical protein
VTVPPPIFDEPILFFQWTQRKLSVLRFAGVNSTDIGAIKGAVMSEQKRYRRAVSKRRVLSDTLSAEA